MRRTSPASEMATDYYDTLGVSRTASGDEINRAYRDLARKYHPDLNPDDESAKKKFQEVQIAFEVLNDPKKREQYDRFGPAFEQFKQGGGGQWPGGSPGGRGGASEFEFDLGDLFGGGAGQASGGGFADLFKHFGGGGPKGRSPGPTQQKGADLAAEVTVPLRTAVSGGEASITLQRTGGKNETITVKIPAGVDDGQKIRLRGQGNPGVRGGDPGDILLTVRVASHPQYRRTGDRLDVTVPITLAEAALGAKVDLPTPKGVITLTVPSGSSSGARLRVKGHGVEKPGATPGDLYAELQVVLPKGLREEDAKKIAEVSEGYDQAPREDLRW